MFRCPRCNSAFGDPDELTAHFAANGPCAAYAASLLHALGLGGDAAPRAASAPVSPGRSGGRAASSGGVSGQRPAPCRLTIQDVIYRIPADDPGVLHLGRAQEVRVKLTTGQVFTASLSAVGLLFGIWALAAAVAQWWGLA